MTPCFDLLIVGNGMGTGRLLQRLRESGYAGRIAVVGDEPHPAYSRILLSSVLAGDKAYADIFTLSHAWYAENDVMLFSGERAVELQPEIQQIRCASGLQLSYRALVLATGSRPSLPGIPGEQLSGVIGFRAIADSQAMERLAASGGHAVVLGGGLLGLEAAAGLRHLGMDVTVVHRNRLLMNRQLDAIAAGWLREAMENRGIRVLAPAGLEAIMGEQQVEQVRFSDGSVREARLVVLAAGITPNEELAREAGLNCQQGILVDDHLATSDPRIHALGECSRHRGLHYGLVAPIWEQVEVLARRLNGDLQAEYHGSDLFTQLKVDGIPLFSAGQIEALQGQDTLSWHDPHKKHYRKLILEQDQLHGAVLFGEQQDGAWYADLIRNRSNISSIRDHLIFGRRFCAAV